MYSNIVFAEVDSKHREVEMRISRNVYCRPQLIVFLTAPSDQAFIELVADRHRQIATLLNEQEFSRERRLLAKKHSLKVKQQAEKQFGISILAPPDIDQIKTGHNFFWASASQQDLRLNICIYTLPLCNLTQELFVAARDSVMKANIPGAHEGQWMETDSRTVSSQQLPAHDGRPAHMEVRGLWDMRDDALGGPFVSYVQLDERHDLLLVTEGFVLAPEERKRPHIRKLEAALQTVSYAP